MSESPIPKLLLRRKRLRAGGIVTLIVALLSILLDRGGAFGYKGDDWSTFNGQRLTVVEVVDGDTLYIKGTSSEKTRVRLIGVDAPEMDPPSHWGDRATAYTRGRLAGKQVTVKLDGTQSRDHYGRLLAYLYVTDSDNFNFDLIRDGQAYADRRHGHSLRSQFEIAETESRKKGRGLWKEVRDDQQPEWRKRWLRNRLSGSPPKD